MHCQVAWWHFASLVGCHAVHDKASGMPDVMPSTYQFHSWQTEYASFNIQKKVPMALQGEGNVMRLLFLLEFCNAFPCSVLFLYERDETSFSQTHRMLFHWCLCSSVTKHNIQGAQIFQYLKLSTISWIAQSPTPAQLPFPWLLHFNSLWQALQFFLCFSLQRQFGNKCYKTDHRCHCSCL